LLNKLLNFYCFSPCLVPGVGYLKALKSSQGPAIFAGIPYAEPPVGAGRWTNPKPASPLPQDGQYYDATSPGPACPQLCTLPSPEYVCPKQEDVSIIDVSFLSIFNFRIFFVRKLLLSDIGTVKALSAFCYYRNLMIII